MLASCSLVLSTGCKKDEPEEAAEAEKASPEKVEDPELAQKEGALKIDETDPPKAGKRPLVKRKDKPGVRPKAVAKADPPAKAGPRVKPGRISPKRPTPGPKRPGAGEPPVADKPGPRLRPGARRPTAARDEVDDAEAEDDEDDEDDELEPERRPARPTVRPGIRPGRDPSPGAIEADDEPPVGPGPRRPGSRRPADRTVPPAALPRPNMPSRVKPNAELMLRLDDLKELLEIAVAGLDVHGLAGAEGDNYDGIYYGSTDGATYVAGVQVWKPRSPIEAQRRYTQMVRSYPNAEENNAITSKTFIAHWNDLIYLAFYDSAKQTVVSLTCHRERCNDPKKLVLLGLRIKERL